VCECEIKCEIERCRRAGKVRVEWRVCERGQGAGGSEGRGGEVGARRWRMSYWGQDKRRRQA